jgi:hypothetical protein
MTSSPAWVRFQKHAKFCDALWSELRALEAAGCGIADPRYQHLFQRINTATMHLCLLYDLLPANLRLPGDAA